jgi:hypothetical protein
MDQMTPRSQGSLVSRIPDTSRVIPRIAKYLPTWSTDDLTSAISSASSMDATEALDGLSDEDTMVCSAALPLLHGADASKLIADLDSDQITEMVSNMSPNEIGELLTNVPSNDFDSTIGLIPDEELLKVMNSVDANQLSNIIDNMADDVCNDFFASLPPETAVALMDKLPNGAASILTKLNGPRAATGMSTPPAVYPLRIPRHEPWIRSDNKSNTDMTQKYKYDDPNIGRTNKTRNKYWSR